jgi:pimeloyl-ACP methyl ester carboxylesterase
MFSPGGFDAKIGNWVSLGVYRRLELIATLSREFTCIAFDRREAGDSAGRVEILSWSVYARQGLELLRHLGFESAHLMGGCVGCSIATTLAVERPEAVRSMTLYLPAGGARYRIKQHRRFATHAAFAAREGMRAIVDLALSTEDSFSADARVGPWATPLRGSATFRDYFVSIDLERYLLVVAASQRGLFDRDTVPGPEPEALLQTRIPTLVVSGHDESHAPSAAHYLNECLPASELWDPEQHRDGDAEAAQLVRRFLNGA